MSFEQVLTEDRRFAVLSILERSPGFEANETVIRVALDRVGHHASHDRLRNDLSWLAEQGLIRLETVTGTLVAALTRRGADVAAGRTTVPGVRRADPAD